MPGTYADQLRQTSDELEQRLREAREANVYALLGRVDAAVGRVERAWSGSNMGYQASVYYSGFAIPPAGHYFSSEWGFFRASRGATYGDWLEMPPEAVVDEIRELSGVEVSTERSCLSRIRCAGTSRRDRRLSCRFLRHSRPLGRTTTSGH